MENRKLASSGTEEGLKKMIAEFYYTRPDNIKLEDNGSVRIKTIAAPMHTTWSKTRKRYIFWMGE